MELGRRVRAQAVRHVIKLACHIQIPASREFPDVKLLCIRVDDAEIEHPVSVDCGRLEPFAEVVTAPAGEG